MIGYSVFVRPPNPDVPHDTPTEEERRLGSWFECRGCQKEWPLRLSDVRERRMCHNCGRALRRERQAATRERSRAGTLERPVEPQKPKKVEPASANVRGLDLSDPSLHADLYEGRVPDDVSQTIDALIEQAVARKAR